MLQSGVYNPWIKKCSNATGPVHRKMYVRQPKAAGSYPLFVFLVGTLRAGDNGTAKGIVDRAAARGFVAASVDYDSIAAAPGARDFCDTLEEKTRCTFSTDTAVAPEGAVRLLCDNKTVKGGSGGLKADCSKGIIVAGFSQGGLLALRARNHNARVKAAWVMGHHHQGKVDNNPLLCVHGADGKPAGTRKLPSNRARVVVGQSDSMLKGPHQAALEATTGKTCPANTTGPCLGNDGSGPGWGIVPDSECGGSCVHEYLDNAAFWEKDRWWGAAKSLDWLAPLVSR